MSEQDVHFLDSQGCFRIPGRQAVEQFIREYFLHVHPGLPLLDESRFWEMYSTTGSLRRDSLSLFVFQAIFFVSCSVCVTLVRYHRYSAELADWLSFFLLQPSDPLALNRHAVQGPHTTDVPRCVSYTHNIALILTFIAIV